MKTSRLFVRIFLVFAACFMPASFCAKMFASSLVIFIKNIKRTSKSILLETVIVKRSASGAA